MRCCSCETLLSPYLEGELSALQAAAVAKHLRSCTPCSELLDRTKIVDALLMTARAPVELPPNFSFAVMAEVRSAAPMRVRATMPWVPLLAYLVFAWLLVTGWFLADRTAAQALPQRLGAVGATLWRALFETTGMFAHAVGVPFVTAAVLLAVILAADLVALAAIVLFYRRVRPRLAARLAGPERG